MAKNDNKGLRCGCESPEQIAYQLMMHLLHSSDEERRQALDLYSECLEAAQGSRYRDA